MDEKKPQEKLEEKLEAKQTETQELTEDELDKIAGGSKCWFLM